ncbi:MAG: HmuY family protein [Myxococcales bacterium]|nr:HmuY family protein [Myxococcales bacterium]MBL0192707.1 HmuY family protein [Myxococcales bacterium]HQY63976.1 HmuY family protein [Polyangiaceae bacterium]
MKTLTSRTSSRTARAALVALVTLAAGWATACSDSATARPDAGTGQPGGGGAVEAATAFASGQEIAIAVPEKGKVFLSLSPLGIVPAPADPRVSTGWDMAFEQYTITTNGGVSGPGQAASFGPLDAAAFVGDAAPTVPFLVADKAAGAFLDWFAYEGAPSHALFSRFHVVGVKDGERLWKVQLLSYYGERDGAPISALYSLRYAELTDRGEGPTQQVDRLEGTAGGPGGGPNEPSELLDLATGARSQLTPADALASRLWHLSFRRQTVGVNGGLGGPRGVAACDLDEAGLKDETMDVVRARTPESERARFASVTRASFDGRSFRADGVVSGFSDAWVDRAGASPAPAYATWIVVDAEGNKFMIGFSKFVSASTTSPGTIVMHLKPVSR